MSGPLHNLEAVVSGEAAFPPLSEADRKRLDQMVSELAVAEAFGYTNVPLAEFAPKSPSAL